MKKVLLILTIGSVVAFSGCNKVKEYTSPEQLVSETLKMVKEITAKELNELMNSEEIYTLIDVRQKTEHYYGFIPGSLVIPRGSIEFLIGNEDYWEEEGLYMPLKDETIIVYCKKGNRGVLAAASLRQLGYKNVHVLKGGWKTWELTYPDLFEKSLDKLFGSGPEKHDDGGGC